MQICSWGLFQKGQHVLCPLNLKWEQNSFNTDYLVRFVLILYTVDVQLKYTIPHEVNQRLLSVGDLSLVRTVFATQAVLKLPKIGLVLAFPTSTEKYRVGMVVVCLWLQLCIQLENGPASCKGTFAGQFCKNHTVFLNSTS